VRLREHLAAPHHDRLRVPRGLPESVEERVTRNLDLPGGLDPIHLARALLSPIHDGTFYALTLTRASDRAYFRDPVTDPFASHPGGMLVEGGTYVATVPRAFDPSTETDI